MVGNCPVGDQLVPPRPSLGAFCFPRVLGGSGAGRASPAWVPCRAEQVWSCWACSLGWGGPGAADGGAFGRCVGLVGEHAGPCLPPRGWAGCAPGAGGSAPQAGRAVPWGAPTATPRAAPAAAEPGYAGAGGEGVGSALPALSSAGTGRLSSCPAGFGTAGVQARRAGLASAGCRHGLPGC